MAKKTDKKEFGKIRIQVQMLGDFSVIYEGKKIALGKRTNYKFLQLLQMVWLSGGKGIAKEQAARALYDGSDIADINNSMNNLLYQLRMQLARAGLPKGDYIVSSRGVYLPDQRFVIELDVNRFSQRIYEAQQVENEDIKAACYQEAFELYCGELLPMISTELWVVVESMRLKAIYEDCVEWLEYYYRERNDYNTLERLYGRTAKIYPYDKWKIKQIDLLAEKEDYKEAYALYNKMVREYTEAMGLSPTEEMLKCYERISKGVRRMPQSIEMVRREMQEYMSPADERGGAFFCSYRSFIDITHVYKNSMERTGKSVFVMLCTLLDYEGKVIYNQEKLKEFAEIFKNIIYESLRKGDAFTQYSSSQYLVLLSGLRQENCDIIQKRINHKLKERLDRRTTAEYTILSLAEIIPVQEDRKRGA